MAPSVWYWCLPARQEEAGRREVGRKMPAGAGHHSDGRLAITETKGPHHAGGDSEGSEPTSGEDSFPSFCKAPSRGALVMTTMFPLNQRTLRGSHGQQKRKTLWFCLSACQGTSTHTRSLRRASISTTGLSGSSRASRPLQLTQPATRWKTLG